MSIQEAFAILDSGVGSSHDPSCVEALKKAISCAELMRAA